jgi:heterotetrameric sarcosine oxidase gamma subunit
VNLDFLSPGSGALAGESAGAAGAAELPIARSPMERSAAAEGARFEVRDGWNVAVAFGATPEQEADAVDRTAVWADVSHLGKLELQAPASELSSIVAACTDGAELELGSAARIGDAWWCPLSPTRALVICEVGELSRLRERLVEAAAGAERAHVIDVSTTFAALTLAGPLGREVFARFSAIDLRPQVTTVGALRPGSIARQPAILVCEAESRYLFLFGWATGEYIWSVVSDAGFHLGGRPIGADALAKLPGPAPVTAPGQEASRA